MPIEEAETLKHRAEAFLRNAERLIQEGEWDLAMFSLEQYCKLALKYKLLIRRGSYPRTHSLKLLIRLLAEDEPRLLELLSGENLQYVARLEEAYIVARYVPYTYEEAEVRDVHRFVTQVFSKIPR